MCVCVCVRARAHARTCVCAHMYMHLVALVKGNKLIKVHGISTFKMSAAS
jgi:hypothetical protein